MSECRLRIDALAKAAQETFSGKSGKKKMHSYASAMTITERRLIDVAIRALAEDLARSVEKHQGSVEKHYRHYSADAMIEIPEFAVGLFSLQPSYAPPPIPTPRTTLPNNPFEKSVQSFEEEPKAAAAPSQSSFHAGPRLMFREEQQVASTRLSLSLATEQRSHMHSIERDSQTLAEMFQSISVLVQNQSAGIEAIGANVAESEHYTRLAEVEVRRKLASMRRRQWWMFLFFCMTLGIFFVLYAVFIK